MLAMTKYGKCEGTFLPRRHHLRSVPEHSPATKDVRLTLDVSYELNERLEQLAKESVTTTSEVLRKAFTLFDLVADASKQNNRIAILDQDKNFLTEIVGI